MENKAQPKPWRDTIGGLLRDNRMFIASEVVLLVVLTLAGISSTTIVFFMIGWLSLWLRRSGWKDVGMSRAANWLRTIFLALGISILYQFFSIGFLVPVLNYITNTPLDLALFESLQGDYATLVLWLVVTWSLAAFGEEMVYRGYIFNRVTDLFGKSRLGWGIGVLVSAVLFGLLHMYQGLPGVLETTVFGLVMAGLYLVTKRNLWLPILVHGINNTIGILLIFLGLYP